jgi:hypothetical protein
MEPTERLRDAVFMDALTRALGCSSLELGRIWRDSKNDREFVIAAVTNRHQHPRDGLPPSLENDPEATEHLINTTARIFDRPMTECQELYANTPDAYAFLRLVVEKNRRQNPVTPTLPRKEAGSISRVFTITDPNGLQFVSGEMPTLSGGKQKSAVNAQPAAGETIADEPDCCCIRGGICTGFLDDVIKAYRLPREEAYITWFNKVKGDHVKFINIAREFDLVENRDEHRDLAASVYREISDSACRPFTLNDDSVYGFKPQPKQAKSNPAASAQAADLGRQVRAALQSLPFKKFSLHIDVEA